MRRQRGTRRTTRASAGGSRDTLSVGSSRGHSGELQSEAAAGVFADVVDVDDMVNILAGWDPQTPRTLTSWTPESRVNITASMCSVRSCAAGPAPATSPLLSARSARWGLRIIARQAVARQRWCSSAAWVRSDRCFEGGNSTGPRLASASALTASVPRWMPPSTGTSSRSLTASTIAGKASALASRCRVGGHRGWRRRRGRRDLPPHARPRGLGLRCA